MRPDTPGRKRIHRRLLSLGLAALLVGGCQTTQVPPLVPAGEPFRLPFPAGQAYLCVQGGPGLFSHGGDQEHAVDFAMDEGTPVLAARSGRVVGVKEDSDQGGLSRRMAVHGNHVRILHPDQTLATYLHLRKDGATVTEGEHVERGQLIGHSGATGWAAAPHLHFQVDRFDRRARRWRSIPVAFEEIPGRGVPRFLRSYRSASQLP